MHERKQLFLKVLKAELEDCVGDVRDLSSLYAKRHNGNEIGEYVNNENQALLQQEIEGIRDMVRSIDHMHVDRYDSLESLVGAVTDLIMKKVRDYDDPAAVELIAKRKIAKVLTYVEDRE